MKKENLSPNKIFEKIINDPLKDTNTYIILGKSGPTGKTRLWSELRKCGLNAIEISEQVYPIVDYSDDQNHYIERGLDHAVIIVLNKPLKRSLTYKNVYA